MVNVHCPSASSVRAMSRNFRRVVQPSGQQPIRIVTYNILADKYSGNHTYCDKQFLDWTYRCKLLLQRLESYNPDLLFLQEVQENIFDTDLKPWMEQHGYSSLYNPKPPAASSSTVGPMEGVSLHFKSSMFSLQADQHISFADHAEQLLPQTCCSFHAGMQSKAAATPSTSPAAAAAPAAAPAAAGAGQTVQGPPNTFMEAMLQRQEGAVMALLQHVPSQQQLVACSTHLHWNPNFPDVKLAQAAILCDRIADFIKQQQQQQQQGPHTAQPQQSPPLRSIRQQKRQRREQQQQQQVGSQELSNFPVVVGGDFNSTWRKYTSDSWDKVKQGQPITSGVYELLSTGQVLPSHKDHPQSRQLCQSSGCSRLKQEGSSQEDLLGYTFTTAGLQLQSSQFVAHGREPTLTTRTQSYSGCLDYIWLSQQDWQVQSTLEMPYEEPQGEPGPPDGVTNEMLDPCPNKNQPSDHLAVGCEAVLLPAGAAAVGTAAEAAGAAAAGRS